MKISRYSLIERNAHLYNVRPYYYYSKVNRVSTLRCMVHYCTKKMIVYKVNGNGLTMKYLCSQERGPRKRSFVSHFPRSSYSGMLFRSNSDPFKKGELKTEISTAHPPEQDVGTILLVPYH